MANPIIDAYNGSDFFGKIIFLSLIFLSITTWIIFIQKFYLQKLAKQKGRALSHLFHKKYFHPLSLEIEETHPYASIYQTLKKNTLALLVKNKSVLNTHDVTLSTADIDLIESHLMHAIAMQIKKMDRYLFLLSTIVSLAPFLGLLGTVWGILLTFNELQATHSVSTNTVIMGGLAMALGTTVVGLLVAIPALIGYNYLRAESLRLTTDMEDFSHALITSVELQYRQVEVK